MKTLFLQAPVVRRFRRRRRLALPGASAKSTRSGIRPGSPSRPRWCPAAGAGCARRRPARRTDARDRGAVRTRHHPHSTPSFPTDAQFAERSRREPQALIGMVGAKVAVDPHRLAAGQRGASISSCREEFDYTCKEIAEGRAVRRDSRPQLSRCRTARSCTTRRAPIIEDMDALPFVAPVYKRDLKIENYFIGYLKHPYVSIYTGPRLPLALHVLPVAADGRRASLPHALGRERARRSEMDPATTCPK